MSRQTVPLIYLPNFYFKFWQLLHLTTISTDNPSTEPLLHITDLQGQYEITISPNIQSINLKLHYQTASKMLLAKKNFAVLKEQVPNFPFPSHGISHNNTKITTKISSFYIYLSNRFYNSCRRVPETKRHSSLFLHWSCSKFLVVMASCTPSIHVFLDVLFPFFPVVPIP